MKYTIQVTDSEGAKLVGILDLKIEVPDLHSKHTLESIELDWIFQIEKAINVKTSFRTHINLLEEE